jgi:hypothetical protein
MLMHWTNDRDKLRTAREIICKKNTKNIKAKHWTSNQLGANNIIHSVKFCHVRENTALVLVESQTETKTIISDIKRCVKAYNRAQAKRDDADRVDEGDFQRVIELK